MTIMHLDNKNYLYQNRNQFKKSTLLAEIAYEEHQIDVPSVNSHIVLAYNL